ncbi:hypothetical protein AB0L53_33070 [Nonomuraea sp. NPDC052129]|uniref:hypothetical protein n=1 Tax=Nonomuraea sp. NPDC052129 TaxID=3154651 RepID=UPI00341F46CB
MTVSIFIVTLGCSAGRNGPSSGQWVSRDRWPRSKRNGTSMFTHTPRADATGIPTRPARRRARRRMMLAVAAPLSVALAGITTTPANADPLPDHRFNRHHHFFHRFHKPVLTDSGNGCEPGTFVRAHSLRPHNFFIPRTRYTDGPGGSMTVSVHHEYEVLAFVEADKIKTKSVTDSVAKTIGSTVTTEDILRALTREVTPHLEKRHMIFTGHDYTQNISKGKYGNMWYRVFGYRIGWGQWARLHNCAEVRIATGIADIPSRIEGWRYWETDHPIFRGHKLSDK